MDFFLTGLKELLIGSINLERVNWTNRELIASRFTGLAFCEGWCEGTVQRWKRLPVMA